MTDLRPQLQSDVFCYIAKFQDENCISDEMSGFFVVMCRRHLHNICESLSPLADQIPSRTPTRLPLSISTPCPPSPFNPPKCGDMCTGGPRFKRSRRLRRVLTWSETDGHEAIAPIRPYFIQLRGARASCPAKGPTSGIPVACCIEISYIESSQGNLVRGV